MEKFYALVVVCTIYLYSLYVYVLVFCTSVMCKFYVLDVCTSCIYKLYRLVVHTS